MKRFVAEKNAFDAEEESQGDHNSYGNGNTNARASGSGSNNNGSSNGGGLANRLNGRIVQAGIGSMSGYGTPEPEGVYDPVSFYYIWI